MIIIAVAGDPEPARELNPDEEADRHSDELHRAGPGNRADEERAEPFARPISARRPDQL
jgi:hypothetical protein